MSAVESRMDVETGSNGVLLKPKNLDEILWSVQLTEVARFADDAEKEVERRKRLAEIARRPQQKDFSMRIRRNYGGTCAVTGCCTAEALEAAHIRLEKDADINCDDNGVLLRCDIHALFDSYLITLSTDGRNVEVSSRLNDQKYEFLRGAPVTQPLECCVPSLRNIENHRERFLHEESSRSKKSNDT